MKYTLTCNRMVTSTRFLSINGPVRRTGLSQDGRISRKSESEWRRREEKMTMLVTLVLLPLLRVFDAFRVHVSVPADPAHLTKPPGFGHDRSYTVESLVDFGRSFRPGRRCQLSTDPVQFRMKLVISTFVLV